MRSESVRGNASEGNVAGIGDIGGEGGIGGIGVIRDTTEIGNIPGALRRSKIKS